MRAGDRINVDQTRRDFPLLVPHTRHTRLQYLVGISLIKIRNL